MPLMHGKSDKAFSKNVSTEMHAGKPLKQSLAIAYAMKRKAQHKAEGGEMHHPKEEFHPHPCTKHGAYECQDCGKHMAEGGFVHEEEQSGYLPEPHENPEHHYAHEEENQEFPEEEHDLVGRIMKHRKENYKGYMAHGGMMHHSKHYSEGGKVANEEHMHPDEEANEFDNLVKDDDLSEHYTGENSGDEDGDYDEDERKHDVVSRIMKQRRMKDRNPRPA